MAIIDTIRALQADVDGDTLPRGSVTDALLDLRLEADPGSHLVARIDAALADIPGRTMVVTSWWAEQLEDLAQAADASPVA